MEMTLKSNKNVTAARNSKNSSNGQHESGYITFNCQNIAYQIIWLFNNSVLYDSWEWRPFV